MNLQSTSSVGMRLSHVGGYRGAPMGRGESHINRNAAVQLVVHVCPLDEGGYDEGGAYWGVRRPGEYLWRAVDETTGVEFYFDASGRIPALEIVHDAYPNAVVVETPAQRWTEEFVIGYVRAAFALSSCSDPTSPGEEIALQTCPVAEETEAAMRADCVAFITANAASLTAALASGAYAATTAGADFWLTRSGDGTGYWDRDDIAADIAEALTSAAREAGVRDLYLGDDGRVYQA